MTSAPPPIPRQRATKKETFETLAEDFSLGQKTLALLMDSQMDTLEDLRFYFAEEKDIDTFVAQADGLLQSLREQWLQRAQGRSCLRLPANPSLRAEAVEPCRHRVSM